MTLKIAIQTSFCLALMFCSVHGQIIETEILPEPQGDRVWRLGDETPAVPPRAIESAPRFESAPRTSPQGTILLEPAIAPPGLPSDSPPPIAPPTMQSRGIYNDTPPPPKISPLRLTPKDSSNNGSASRALPDGIKPIFAPEPIIYPADSFPPIVQSNNISPLSDPQTFSLGTGIIVDSCDCEDACDCKNPDAGTATSNNDSAYPTARVTGFFHLDSAWFNQDRRNRRTLGDINDGLGFRRARLAAKGNVSEDIEYILEFDLAQSQARFVDVWVQANNTRFGNVRIGRYRQPFGMSELTSVRELPFLERPVTFTQSPFRQTGVMLFDTMADERGTWALSGYRFLSDNFGNVFADNGGYGMATRLTRIRSNPNNDRLVHMGAGYSFNDPGRGVVQLVSTNEVFLAQNPNLGPAGLSVLPIEGVTPFVNTGELATNNVQFLNFELAAGLGRLALQGEARFVKVDLANGPTAIFPGAYAQFRYMLTGETIPYNKKNGVFGRIVPDRPWTAAGGGPGAWEAVGRVSHIDLIDGGVSGRRLTDFTAGANWYWNQYMKLQFNYIHSRLEDTTIGASQANTFAVRAQLDF